MSVRYLTETTVRLIEDTIRQNINAALDAVNTISIDQPRIFLPDIKNYYYSPKNSAYDLPALYIIPVTVDFRKQEKGANFIDAKYTINVSIEVEEKNTDNLAVLCWRFQAALHEILDDAQLTNADQTVKLVSKVTRAEFSPTYTDSQKSGSQTGVFRQEALLVLEVDHFERP